MHPRQASAEGFPLGHQEEARARVQGAPGQPRQQVMIVPASELFALFLAQAPGQAREVDPKLRGHSPQHGEVKAQADSFGQAFLLEGQRAEELPARLAQPISLGVFHGTKISGRPGRGPQTQPPAKSDDRVTDGQLDLFADARSGVAGLLLLVEDVVDAVEERMRVHVQQGPDPLLDLAAFAGEGLDALVDDLEGGFRGSLSFRGSGGVG